ncbi:helix-turn-helix domain-containing protein [Streptomyces sp. NBC_01483]|uniref:helix-turn-helix domain-containing protein n=1 Tax=Streptomyces sp. NBC_01483 TaxID=2903883 RepID=UPI002E2F19A8|nr:helix-turn-helix domain-containing protein [Streptomyces sp. NBC_01483]
MATARPVTLGGGTGRVNDVWNPARAERQPMPRSGSGQPQGAILPVEPQSHPHPSHTEISSSRRRRSVEPVLMDTSEVAAMLNMSTSWVYREASKLGLKGYKLGRGRNAKVLYKRAEIFKWLEQ